MTRFHPPDSPVTFRRKWSLTNWLRLATWALLVAVLLGQLGHRFFLFELASHFAVQYVAVAALLLVYWLFRRRWPALPAAVVLLWQGAVVWPWLMARPDVARPDVARPDVRFPAGTRLNVRFPAGTRPGRVDLRVLHANVLYTNTNTERILTLVRQTNPDVFVLQEMTSESIHALKALCATYPYQLETWSKGPCHILVGSRTPFRIDDRAVRTQQVIHLTTRARGRDWSLVTVHPRTPLLPSWFAERNAQLTFVSNAARRENRPTLLIGDFNVSVFSPVYTQLFGQPAGLSACRKGFGLGVTWNRYLPPLMLPIDHAFVNDGFRTVRFQTLDQPGSDHNALLVELAFTD